MSTENINLIELSKIARYRMEVVLGEKSFILDIYWVERGLYWAFDLLSEFEKPLVTGVRMVFTYPLLDLYSFDGMPAGDLYLITTDVDNSGEPTFEDVERYGLLYVE